MSWFPFVRSAVFKRRFVHRWQSLMPGENAPVVTCRRLPSATAAVCGYFLLACGCATSGPYQYGRFHPERPEGVDLQPVAVEHGKPHKSLDRIANVLATPAKVLRLNSKVDNHEISDETIEKLVAYLEKNDITDVCVDVNHYAPREQWRRMRENKRIAPGWKYTAGTLSWVRYTVFPGRVFGGTDYNAFTNSLYVNSDVPAMLLFEAAYAKDIHSQKHPGFYAVIVNDFPGVKVWRQARAVKDVVSYAKEEQDWAVEKETYKVMYAHLGAEAVGTLGILITGPTSIGANILIGSVLGLSGAAAGHAVGHSAIRQREAELEESQSEPAVDEDSSMQAQVATQDDNEKQVSQPLRRVSYSTESAEDDGSENDLKPAKRRKVSDDE